MKPLPKITLPDYITVPGDTRVLVATVEVGGAPRGGLSVHFSIEGYQGIGQANTGRNGKASLSFTIPNTFKAQVWTVKATIAATADTLPAETTGKLTVIKGATIPVLGNLIFGTYKNEPGKYPSIIVNIVQNYGTKKTIEVPFQMTVNGTTWTIQPSILHEIVLVPTDAASWSVKATFFGNESYTASEASGSYNRPQ